MTDYKNILIIKPSALGDIVHALPVMGSLRASFPTARISWLVRREFAPLLECVEGLDEILLFDRTLLGHWYYRRSAFKALRHFMHTLKSNHYDLVLDFQGLFRTALFTHTTGCPVRMGMADSREFAGLFYTQKIQRPADSVHVLDYYNALLKAAGVEHFSAACDLTPPEEATQTILQKMSKHRLHSKKFAILIPSSAHTDKCWPAERFAAIAEKLHDSYGFDIAAVGTGQDKAIVRAIQSHCRIPIADFTGQTSIKELLALFYQAGTVISNDTGPGYMAIETGMPTVIIYGNVNPQRVAPYHRPECIAAIEPDQRGVGIRTTNPAHDIKNVTLDMVWEKLNALLIDIPLNETPKQ